MLDQRAVYRKALYGSQFILSRKNSETIFKRGFECNLVLIWQNEKAISRVHIARRSRHEISRNIVEVLESASLFKNPRVIYCNNYI